MGVLRKDFYNQVRYLCNFRFARAFRTFSIFGICESGFQGQIARAYQLAKFFGSTSPRDLRHDQDLLMAVTTNLNLNKEELAQLAGILKMKPVEIEAKFASFADAAVEEYARMFLGQKVFTRGSDIREYRLFLLIRRAFGNLLPDEQTVCDLFQCTLSQSRALIRSVTSKYQYELRDAIETALKEAIKGVRKDSNGKLVFTVASENIVAGLNRLLAALDLSQDEVIRSAGKLATYELKPAAYTALCKRLNLTAKAISE